MKIAVLCKSDSTGGAAIVSRRLTEALISEGAQATMLVEEKLSEEPFVVKAGYTLRSRYDFLAERAQIFFRNGFSRKNLFKVDTAAYGLPLYDHPVVKEADAVILNWVNQGMLSLDGIRRIARSGKRIIWTMHDMWNLTGICHHSMDCHHFTEKCGDCFLLGSGASPADLSNAVWRRKLKLYDETDIKFVAVSRWLADRARKSSLLKDRDVSVIPNPFRFESQTEKQSVSSRDNRQVSSRGKLRVLFSAASLDNWIKGLSTFRMAIDFLKENNPELTDKIELVFAGNIRNPEVLKEFPLSSVYAGMVSGESALARLYSSCNIVVNSSLFENLPGTLIEGQAYGCIPVAFDRGGQRDIIDHLSTGYLAPWDDAEAVRAKNLAQGIAWAGNISSEERAQIALRMQQSVREKFSYRAVARQYLNLL